MFNKENLLTTKTAPTAILSITARRWDIGDQQAKVIVKINGETIKIIEHEWDSTKVTCNVGDTVLFLVDPPTVGTFYFYDGSGLRGLDSDWTIFEVTEPVATLQYRLT